MLLLGRIRRKNDLCCCGVWWLRDSRWWRWWRRGRCSPYRRNSLVDWIGFCCSKLVRWFFRFDRSPFRTSNLANGYSDGEYFRLRHLPRMVRSRCPKRNWPRGAMVIEAKLSSAGQRWPIFVCVQGEVSLLLWVLLQWRWVHLTVSQATMSKSLEQCRWCKNNPWTNVSSKTWEHATLLPQMISLVEQYGLAEFNDTLESDWR